MERLVNHCCLLFVGCRDSRYGDLAFGLLASFTLFPHPFLPIAAHYLPAFLFLPDIRR